MASKNKKMMLVFGDVTLGVHGETAQGTVFDYIFSYQTGGMESLVLNGMEWLYRTPKPTFWRATTDNDRGNGFSRRSAMWLGADLFLQCTDVQVKLDGKTVSRRTAPGNNKFGAACQAEKCSIKYTYLTATVPETRVTVRYTVTPDAAVRVDVHYYGAEGLPELPVFGMRLIMPTPAKDYAYTGLSGETYPDRMAGGVKGHYTVEGLPVTPYLVPQDCGVHMQTKALVVHRESVQANETRLQRQAVQGLCFTALKQKFAFSCLPYTAEELENATHHEELPPVRRTVVSILGAVRGVGGIDSWGSDVEDGCHISAEQDIKFSFEIRPEQSYSK